MFPLLAVFAGLSTVGLIMLVRAARVAPEGFEDAKGFHSHGADHQDAATPYGANFTFEDLFSLDQHMASQPWS